MNFTTWHLLTLKLSPALVTPSRRAKYRPAAHSPHHWHSAGARRRGRGSASLNSLASHRRTPRGAIAKSSG